MYYVTPSYNYVLVIPCSAHSMILFLGLLALTAENMSHNRYLTTFSSWNSAV